MTSKTTNRHSSEVRERAVRMVMEVEHAGDHPSRRAALIGPRPGRRLPRRGLPSVPQEFVDCGLGARLGVHALDDHGAVERWPAVRVRQGLRGHHGIGRHLAARDLAGRAVDDFGRGRNIDAHGQHRTLADDDALHDLGTGTDEAVVLDAGRIAPGRLTWAK